MGKSKRALASWMQRHFGLDNQVERDAWVRMQLSRIPAGARLLDAGCGGQRYRPDCAHLSYTGQDFGQYTVDVKGRIGSAPLNEQVAYEYGDIDVVSNIWDIPLDAESFDVVLCTEVIEHVPYPIETVRELARLLRPGGTLILTAPSNALRHQDPFFFTSGFSDRWFERILPEAGLQIKTLDELGDYYSWMKVEMARTAGAHGWGARILMAPAFFYFAGKKPTELSRSALPMGYLVSAVKRQGA